MRKYANLEKDKKLYKIISKTLKYYKSEREFFRDLKKFNKLIKGHEKLLMAIGKL